MKERKSVQVKTVVPLPIYERLSYISKEYGFRSPYQLVQYLVKSFIKVADPKPDEVVPVDIELMFEGFETVANSLPDLRKYNKGTQNGIHIKR